MSNALKIIQQAMNTQPTGVEVAFREAIKPAINKTIEMKRTEVGASLFKTTTDTGQGE